MKQNIKSLVSGILIGSMLTGGITLAKTGSETLDAWFSDIKIFVNGTKIDPKDANGNTVEPFIVNGTTYLPIRAIGEALQKEVTWDGATASVYLNDTKRPTETPEPLETPKPTITPSPTPTAIPTQKPSEFSYATEKILQISGYQEDAIKGSLETAWDQSQLNASFSATMRCNNGGLADYIDCSITLLETLSTSADGFTGYFKVTMNDAVRNANIKGTVTVDGNKLSLHTEEYDYRLVATLKEESAKEEMVTFLSLDAINYNGEKADGLIGLEFENNQTQATLNGSFAAGDKKYTLQLHEVTSLSDNQLQGIFSVICDGATLINRANGVIKELSAPLGDVMTLTIEGSSILKLRVIEIGY